MSSRVTTTAHYRPILKSALHHVFVKRDVWFFGIFALLLGSGSAIETVLRARNGIEQFNAPFLNRVFPYLELLRGWWDQFAVLSPTRAISTLVILGLVFLGLILLSVLSQGVIIHGAKSRRGHATISDLTHHTKGHLSNIFLINILTKLLLTLCVVILLAPLTSNLLFLSDLLLFLQAMVGYGLMLVISLLGVFSLAGVVNHGTSLSKSISDAWSIVRRHPSASCEIIFILFLINLAIGAGVLLFLLLLSLPYTFFFLLGAATGSLLATTLSTTITFLIVIAVLILAGGTTTAYNYTVLTLLYERLRQGRFKSKLHRLRTTKYWF